MFRNSTRVHCQVAFVAGRCPSLLLAVCLCLFCPANAVHAAVVASGDVSPSNPSSWNFVGSGTIGSSSYGSLTITDGSYARITGCSVGFQSVATGEIIVDGDGSTLEGTGIAFGVNGTGRLRVMAGGDTHYTSYDVGVLIGSTGEVTVDGNGSTLSGTGIDVGRYGTGKLNITGGGNVHVTGCSIGHETFSTGDVTVDGDGSTLSGTGIDVGRYGTGKLNITRGGNAHATHGVIGYESRSRGETIVNGEGSTWSMTAFDVGYHGAGALRIVDGGEVVCGISYLGHYAGSSGDAAVSGADTAWNSRFLNVGYNGPGTLNIHGDGLVRVSYLTIDYDGNGDSFVNMWSGGALALRGNADDSLTDFLGLIKGSDAIRYWDDSISGWADITGATHGEDYTLRYVAEGDLAGYTVLTVTAVPEPTTLVGLLTLALAGILASARRARR